MKKKNDRNTCIIICLVFILLLSGCSRYKVDDSNLVPFLYFVGKEENIEGRIGLWYLSESDIQLQKEPAVVLRSELKTSGETIWDGTNNFEFLFDRVNVSKELFGRNIRVEWSGSGKEEHKYTFWLSGGQVISDVELEYPENLMDEENLMAYEGAVDYNKEKGIITFILFESTGKQIYVDSIAADTKQHTWKAFDLPAASGITPIYAGDSILLDDWLYCAGENGPVRININSGGYEVLENIEYIRTKMFPQGSYDSDGSDYILPYGIWKDKIIWSVPVNTDNAVVYSYCVFQENSFLGAFYIDDKEQLHIFDVSQSEKVIDLKTEPLHHIHGNEYVILPH